MSRPSKLTDAQKRYIRRAVQLRLKLTNEALAKRLGVCPSTVSNWATLERPLQMKLQRAQRSTHTSSTEPTK